ncbi:DnaJ sub B member 2, partial [Friedmanniomyces endolithicus]
DSQEDIRTAHRKAALVCHLDKAPKDPASQDCARKRFIELAEAYRILRDPSERQRYDEVGFESAIAKFHSASGYTNMDKAMREFEELVVSGEIGFEDQDPADAELLEWWNKPETKSLEPRQCS